MIGGGVGARTTSRGHRFSRVIIRPRYSYSSALSLSDENDPGEYDLQNERHIRKATNSQEGPSTCILLDDYHTYSL